MAITNHERVGKALDLLKDGLAPFVEREFKSTATRTEASPRPHGSSATTALLGKKAHRRMGRRRRC